MGCGVSTENVQNLRIRRKIETGQNDKEKNNIENPYSMDNNHAKQDQRSKDSYNQEFLQSEIVSPMLIVKKNQDPDKTISLLVDDDTKIWDISS